MIEINTKIIDITGLARIDSDYFIKIIETLHRGRQVTKEIKNVRVSRRG